jgi:hypothetical protein
MVAGHVKSRKAIAVVAIGLQGDRNNMSLGDHPFGGQAREMCPTNNKSLTYYCTRQIKQISS